MKAMIRGLKTWLTGETVILFPVQIKLCVTKLRTTSTRVEIWSNLSAILSKIIPERLHFLEIQVLNPHDTELENATHDCYLKHMKEKKKFITYDLFGRRRIAQAETCYGLS